MKITVRLETLPGYDLDVEGEIVDIARHLAHVATFIVNENPFSDGCWQITNVESGMRIGTPYYDNKQQAINETAIFLAKKTEAEVLRGYRRAGVK